MNIARPPGADSGADPGGFRRSTSRWLVGCTVAVVLALVGADGVRAGSNAWTRLGSLTAAVNAVEFSVRHSGLMLVGADSGLYRSSDEGSSWQAAGELGGRNILCLLEAMAGADVWLAGANDGIYVSRDAGFSWQRGQGLDTGVFALAMVADSLYYAGTFGSGVFVSTDIGRTWRPLGGELQTDIIFALATTPLLPGRIYAGTARGVFCSMDEGRTWNIGGLQGMSVRTLQSATTVADAGRLLAGTYGSGLWRSLDQGASWERVDASMPARVIRHLCVDPRSSQVIYAAAGTEGFYRSTDGGFRWEELNAGLPYANARHVACATQGDDRLLGTGPENGLWEITLVARANLVVDQTSLSFGNTTVGTRQTRELVVRNAGELSLNVSRLSIEGNASFTVAPGSLILAAGAVDTLRVIFAPQSRGDKTGSLVMDSGDSDGTRLVVPLTGSGIQGELRANLASMHFGAVRVGQTRDTTVVLTNIGNADLVVRNAFFDAAGFQVMRFVSPQLLRPGERLLLPVRFMPDAARGYTAMLRLDVSTDNALAPIQADGLGTSPRLALTPLRLDFGTVSLSSPVSAEVQITNPGNAPLTVHAAELSGTGFAADLPLPLQVDPADTARVRITFMPLTAGEYHGVLTLRSDVPGEAGTQQVEFSGGGGGLTLKPLESVSVGTHAVDMALVDVDGDGFPDIVSVDSTAGLVHVLTNDGTGTYSVQAAYPRPGSAYSRWDEPVAIAAAPIFGPAPDLVVADRIGQCVSVLRNDGDGGYDVQREDLYSGHRPAAVIAADLDADGDYDLAVANTDTAAVTVFSNNGMGSFGARRSFAVGSGSSALLAAYLDADELLDLVVANRAAGSVSLLYGRAGGTFAPHTDIPVGSEPVDLAVVDFDADGDNDLLVLVAGTHELVLLRNTRTAGGDGAFTVARRQPLESAVTDLAVSDLTADVFSDVIVVGAAGGIFVENDGGRGFSRRDTLVAAGEPRRAHIVDVNADGANDVVLLHADDIQVQLNQDVRRLDPPRPPTDVVARDASQDLGRRIEVLWSAPELDEQLGRTTEYVIYRGLTPDGPFTPVDTLAAGGRRYYRDEDASLGQVFFYYVEAGNALLHSAPSDTVWAESRPAPFFELRLVDQPALSLGDTLRVKVFVTPVEHSLAAVSLYLTFADSALTLIPVPGVDTTRTDSLPFRLNSTVATAQVLENRRHPRASAALDLSLAGLSVGPGVEPVELAELWFRAQRDTVTYITVDDEPERNRRSSVVEAITGDWLLAHIAAPTRVQVRDYNVSGQLLLAGREDGNLGVQATLVLVDAGGDTLVSPLNDEDRLRPGIQCSLDSSGRFRLARIPGGTYRAFAKVATHLQGSVVGDTVTVGDSLSTWLDFQWMRSDSTTQTQLPAGDANDDNQVNLADFGVLVRYYDGSQADVATWQQARAADFNGDGRITLADLFLLADYFGELGMTPVPPGTPAARPVALAAYHDGALAVHAPLRISGFRVSVVGGQPLELGWHGTLWQGRQLDVHKWHAAGSTHLVAALRSGEPGVAAAGILLRLAAAGSGAEPQLSQVELLAADGQVISVGLGHSLALPPTTELQCNYPNPFNPQTVLPFVVGEMADEHPRVRLQICNALGQQIRTLVDQCLAAGAYRAVWDGRDAHGQTVASGVYFARLRVREVSQVRRMLLVR